MKISIGLPFYNNSTTLLNALRSIFAQNHQDWELILMDDGSKDDSLEIARSVRDSRVQVYSDGYNRGLAIRLNQIIDLARAPFLARMDADDMMHPQKLSIQLQFLMENPKIDLIDTALYSLDKDGCPVGIRGQIPPTINLKSVLETGVLNHATILGRTKWFQNNSYNPFYLRGEDQELWCRTVEKLKVFRIAKPLYFCSEGQFNLRNYLSSQRTTRNIIKQYGNKHVGWMMAHSLAMKSYLKGGLYWVAARLKFENYLIAKRNNYLDDLAKIEANNILEVIRKTKIPGIDG